MEGDTQKDVDMPTTPPPKLNNNALSQYPPVPKIPPPREVSRMLKRAPFCRTSSLPEDVTELSNAGGRSKNSSLTSKAGSRGTIGSIDNIAPPKSSALDKVPSKDALKTAPKHLTDKDVGSGVSGGLVVSNKHISSGRHRPITAASSGSVGPTTGKPCLVHTGSSVTEDDVFVCDPDSAYVDFTPGNNLFGQGKSQSAASASSDNNNTTTRDHFANGLRDIGNNLAWSKQHELIVDVNNVPQIDGAVTPPLSPHPGGGSSNNHHPTGATNNNNNSYNNHRGTVLNSTGLKDFKRKFQSLKFSKKSRPASLRYTRAGSLDNNSTKGSTCSVPHLLVNDGISDEDTMHREALLPPTSSGNTNNNYANTMGPKMSGDSKVQFIGDEASLYGTPKEDLSPTKEVESQNPIQSTTNYLKDQIIAFFQPSDNKLAMKLFGNKNALMKEKMRQKAAGNWVIHPCSNFRLVSKILLYK